MNHSFLPSFTDPNKCGSIIPPGKLCGHDIISHTNEAECDYCDYKGVVNTDANNGLACPNCLNLVIKTPIINTHNQGPIGLNEVLRKSREIDYSIQFSSDLFNANTVAIVDINKSIDEDESIALPDKPSKKAGVLFDKITHLQKVIFDRSEENKKDFSLQRALQVELSKLYNQLKEDEREKYRLIDVAYKPKISKIQKDKIKPITVKKRLDKDELRKAALDTGFAEFSIQAMCVSMNIPVSEAVKRLLEMKKKTGT